MARPPITIWAGDLFHRQLQAVLDYIESLLATPGGSFTIDDGSATTPGVFTLDDGGA